MKKQIKIGMIGFGQRGIMLLEYILLKMDDVVISGVCDEYEDRAKQAQKLVAGKKGYTPFCSLNYRDIVEMKEIDAVVISSAWESHIKIAIDAMNAGKYAAMEVGGAYSVEDCWSLVKAYEKTNKHCMLLENACYGRYEMMILNMVKQGVFGEVVHCAGSYTHDLRKEITTGNKIRHYRLRNYINRNCENYPTHELGPIAKILNINNGNRMVSLVSMASSAKGLSEYIKNNPDVDKSLKNQTFKQGDVVTTIIKCAQGQTIVLTLDTTLPGYYTRGLRVKGTKAMFFQENNSIYIDGDLMDATEFNWKPNWNNAEKFKQQYDHPLWKEYVKLGVQTGHGGMDWLVLRAFIESAKNNTRPPIDAYDTASWMSISVLSEQSIFGGGNVVFIPDFTSGQWMLKGKQTGGKYCLDEIYADDTVKIL